MLLVALDYQEARAEDCGDGHTSVVASEAATSRFAMALGSSAICASSPRAAQQLLAYESQTPVEAIGSAGAVISSFAQPRRPAAQQVRTQRRFEDVVLAAAREHDIDPDLLQAIMSVESSANPQARSPVGARGLMQVMPATGQRFGVVDPAALYEPETNVRAASAYLKTLQGLFGNNLPLVLAAYNAGEGAVQKYGRQIPPYRETQAYVRNVLTRYDQLLRARRALLR